MTIGEMIRKYVELRDTEAAFNARVQEGDAELAEMIRRYDISESEFTASEIVDRVRWLALGLKRYALGKETLEGVVLQHLNENNEQSIKTEWGTAYKSTTMSAKVASPEDFFNYVREADAFQLLTSAVAKDAVKEHMEEHQGQPPPGVDVVYFTKVNFRRA